MNPLVRLYAAHVEFSEVSGAEHLEMLQLRDEISEMEDTLAMDERQAIDTADRQLIERASVFYTELARFIDFEERRTSQQIPPSRWWWYLDVLAQLPNSVQRKPEVAAL